MIIVIYGINGVGKDRIAKKISKTNSKILVVSQSKLLMYHLGITNGFTSDTKAEPSAYKKLESIKEKRITRLGETVCRKTLLDLSASGKIVLYLSHLAVAKFFQKKDDRSASKPVGWVKKEADGLIFIRADLKDILVWRKKDERKRTENLTEINLQQQTAEKQWRELVKKTSVPHIVIQNRPLRMRETVKILTEFIRIIGG